MNLRHRSEMTYLKAIVLMLRDEKLIGEKTYSRSREMLAGYADSASRTMAT